MATVREATYDLMRSLGLTTIFGNPGSTEEPFLKDFPRDFTYVLGLQEASVLAMADGYSQGTGRPALVNLHTAPGLGNAMGNLVTAWHNRTPLIVTAGQQTREMLLMEPFLTNVDATMLARPWVKWSYETARAQDAPAALMRAYATALQPPAGPVFLSFPLDDWEKRAEGHVEPRQISHRVAPDPEGIRRVADALAGSRNPALIFGGAIDRAQGWDVARALAEKLRAPVWAAPLSERTVFSEENPQYQGHLPFAIKPLAEALRGHDVVLVVGAPVFRYYPYIAGDYLPEGARLLHITDDPSEAARAPVGDSVLGDPALACAALEALLPASDRLAPRVRPRAPEPAAEKPITAAYLFHTLARVKPRDAVIVGESPSNLVAFHAYVRNDIPASFFLAGSGGLGFGLPAAVGLALAERHTRRNRRVIAVIGDGSAQYSIQALWTAAQLALPVVFVIPRNGEYAVLKAFAAFENTPGVPGLDLPGMDLVKLAEGFGCPGRRVDEPGDVADALRDALRGDRPALLEVAIRPEIPSLR
jgi:benzoylformate decarboxylase